MSESYCGLLNIIILSLLAGSHALLQRRLSVSEKVHRDRPADED